MKIDGRTLPHDTSEMIRRWAVRRVKAGESPSSVMKSYGLCRTTIYRWLRAVQRGGEKALRARQHMGPKAKLTPAQKLKVRHWINGKDPRQYGFDFGLWTRQIVAALIARRFGVKLGVTAVGGEEPSQVGVCDVIKEPFDVGLHNPLRMFHRDDLCQTLQRLMRVALRTKSIRAVPKLRLPDRLQNPTCSILYDSILEAGHS